MSAERLLPCLLALVLLAPAASAQRDMSDVKISVTRVAGTVWMLEGQGGNIGVSAGEDGVLMVDDQFAPLAPKIREAVASLSGGGRVDFVLNTHWHGDHVGGNEIFGREALILAHENVRERMAEGQSAGGRDTPPAPKGALPVVTYEDGISIHFNGEEIRVIHLPHGHTDGDSAVWFTGSGVLHAGDHLFVRRFPFVDLDSGGTVEGYAANLETLLELVPDGVRIIAGHGPLSSADDLRASLEMIRRTRATVSAAMAEGRSLDAIVEAGLGEEWADWSWGFIPEERWIRTLHRDLIEN